MTVFVEDYLVKYEFSLFRWWLYQLQGIPEDNARQLQGGGSREGADEGGLPIHRQGQRRIPDPEGTQDHPVPQQLGDLRPGNRTVL